MHFEMNVADLGGDSTKGIQKFHGVSNTSKV
jgi:hypothetical protein